MMYTWDNHALHVNVLKHWLEHHKAARKWAENIRKRFMTNSTLIQTKLVCGCILEERLEFYRSDVKRPRKTLLRRIYDREENQSPFVKGKNFVNLITTPNCKEHGVSKPSISYGDIGSGKKVAIDIEGKGVEAFYKNVSNFDSLKAFISSQEFNLLQANILIGRILRRVRK